MDMKLIVVWTIFLELPFAYAASFDGGIQGRVLNAQGVPVAGATIMVTAGNGEPRAKAVTAADGVFTISNLESGL
jgi:hypothetical protein